MANVDGELHPAEKKILVALFKSIGVTPDEEVELRTKKSLEKMFEEMKSKQAKNILIDVLAMIAEADGKYVQSEIQFIQRASKRLNLDISNHPFFKGSGQLDMEKVHQNVEAIIDNINLSVPFS